MFVSGVTCALAYGAVQRADGWWAVVSHTLRRGWEIYAAFLTLIIGLVVTVYWAGGDQLADEVNVRVLLQQPAASLSHAAILQYRPVNTDVLPTFVLFHLLFAPLLWLLMKIPNATFAASALLYALVQFYGWNLPQWPRNEWYFNPFAWQVLVVFGAWWVTGGRQSVAASGDFTCHRGAGGSISGIWPGDRAELERQAARDGDPAVPCKPDLSDRQVRSGSAAASALSGNRRPCREVRAVRLAGVGDACFARRRALRRELP